MAIEKFHYPAVFSEAQERLAERLFDRGAIKFDAFKLKLHEKNPDAPLSPIYFALRKPEIGGPLTDEDVKIISGELYLLVRRKRILFDLVAGIPRAGEPFAEVISRLSGRPLLKLGKKVEGDSRKIDSVVSGEYRPGQLILLIDDLITQADTKKEAISVCENEGLIIAGVVVLIDREQGGTQDLANNGYNLYALFPISALLKYYVRSGRIERAKCEEVMAYIVASRQTGAKA